MRNDETPDFVCNCLHAIRDYRHVGGGEYCKGWTMTLLNPWIIVSLLIGAIAIGAGSYKKGYDNGQLAQLAIQNEAINRVNKKLSDNKAEAARLIKERQAEIDTLVAKRDELKYTLEKERANNAKITNDLRTSYANLQLRFKSASSGGSGNGSGGQVSTGSEATSDSETSSCVVSDEVTTALRAIAYDCDTLRDDYKLLYDFVHSEDATDAQATE